MFPGAENKKEKKRADGISSSETYLFLFSQKVFCQVSGREFFSRISCPEHSSSKCAKVKTLLFKDANDDLMLIIQLNKG